MTKQNIVYLGMVTLYNGKGAGVDAVSFMAFDKENAKKKLVNTAGEFLKDFVDAYEVKSDEIDDDAIILECRMYPKKIRYWIKEVKCIDGP